MFPKLTLQQIDNMSKLLLDSGTPSTRMLDIWSKRLEVDVEAIHDYMIITRGQRCMVDCWTVRERSCRHCKRSSIDSTAEDSTSPLRSVSGSHAGTRRDIPLVAGVRRPDIPNYPNMGATPDGAAR